MGESMLNYMSSLVYDWLVTAGDEGLAKKFKEEVKPEPLPSNSQRLSDFVKVYLKETNGERTSESRLCQEESRGRGTGEKMADQNEDVANDDVKETLMKKRKLDSVKAKKVRFAFLYFSKYPFFSNGRSNNLIITLFLIFRLKLPMSNAQQQRLQQLRRERKSDLIKNLTQLQT